MMEQYDVNISIPPSAQSSNVVKISGVDNKVQNAISALEERVKELEKEREDRVSSIVIYISVVMGEDKNCTDMCIYEFQNTCNSHCSSFILLEAGEWSDSSIYNMLLISYSGTEEFHPRGISQP